MKYPILAAYGAVLLLLSVYGLHRLFILYLYFKHRPKNTEKAPRIDDFFPTVTIQLPLFNEIYVVRRLLASVERLDYPRDRLHIQVLDDSTDGTCEVAKEAACELVQKGFSVLYRHRGNRKGYKAGALQEGLLLSQDELVAIFDADFVPPRDFFQRTVPCFQNEGVGMVQARWGYLNRNYSLLTRAQALLLDGHFVLEHTARCFSGRFFNFNGTGGVWRRQAILDSGGWHGDTLTEDLDLSYRAQMRGWRFLFLPDLVCPSELPVEISAFKNQQHRWAKGSIQVSRKILPPLFKSQLPFFIKCEAVFHLLSNMNCLFMAALSFLAPISLILRYRVGLEELAVWEAGFFIFSMLPIGLFYVISQREAGRGILRGLLETPLVFALGIGMCLNNARAILEALFSHESPFFRTAKYRIESPRDDFRGKIYRTLGRGFLCPEALLTVSMAAFLFLMVWLKNWGALPFVLLFLLGYGYVTGLSLAHARR